MRALEEEGEKKIEKIFVVDVIFVKDNLCMREMSNKILKVFLHIV